MIIDDSVIIQYLKEKNIRINGVFHIGAHNCEELHFYQELGVKPENIIWIDALKHKIVEASARGIPNLHQAVITDKDDENVMFNIANNGLSSSILEFGTHSASHPEVHFIGSIELKTVTIDTFVRRNNLAMSKYNFWNLDIQGAELLALRGGLTSIKNVDVIFMEVNETEVYKSGALITQIDEFLYRLGFERVMTNMTENHWGDALYVRLPK